MNPEPSHPEPYSSAHDLPSVRKLQQELAAMEMLTGLIARDQRAKVVDLQRQRSEIYDLVDDFYEVLHGRNWIFTEYLPFSEMQELLSSTREPADVEAGLIRIISDRLKSDHWTMGLLDNEAMKARLSNLKRAREHFLNGHWDSSALRVVTIMDGFVNDIQPAERRGLHAREAEEMVAWDSIVGHHQGLSAVMPAFLKTFRKRHEAEVFEVHRHGMVHGNIINYDNPVVAAKAWNMLGAVSDWARSLEKQATPSKPEPTWSELGAMMKDRSERIRLQDSFVPFSRSSADPEFGNDELVARATSFLESWSTKRWGLVADYIPRTLMSGFSSDGERAVFAKEIYERYPLQTYSITQVSFPQLGGGVVRGTAEIEGVTRDFEVRWLWDSSLDSGSTEGSPARWVLAVVPPTNFMKVE